MSVNHDRFEKSDFEEASQKLVFHVHDTAREARNWNRLDVASFTFAVLLPRLQRRIGRLLLVSIDANKTLTPRIKKPLKTSFYEEIRNVTKRWIKNVVDKLTKLFKPNEKFSTTIYCVSVLYIVHDNVWELWLFIREFPIAAMLNPSVKSRFM